MLLKESIGIGLLDAMRIFLVPYVIETDAVF
jgi:hypothetical protein